MTEITANTASQEDAAAAEAEASAVAQPAASSHIPVTIGAILHNIRDWWTVHVIGQVDQAEVTERRREDGKMSEHYLFMTAMSGGIAVLGLLLSSPAVVIGAMLLSPLMGPIMALGFSLAIGDWEWLKQSAITLLIGSVLAVVLCAVLVFLSPIQTITPEIAGRTRPNLFDLFVALFSALAGAYAMIRGREGAIVGVAIATALMPPLAVVGFGLATWNWTVFSGALLLFVTNFITIALTAFGMAKLYGFRNSLSARNTMFQNIALLTVFVGLAVPLAFSLNRIAWETNAQRIVRSEISAQFDGRSQLDQLDMDFTASPVGIHAVVFTPSLRPGVEESVAKGLTERLGEPVALDLVQYEVGTNESAAERAQLSAARAREDREATARAEALTMRLSLAAGVAPDEVLLDQTRRRALVRAKRLEGASLATYRALEMRIAGTEPGWRVELIPPPAVLPAIPVSEGTPNSDTLDLIGWAALRLDRSVVLAGPADQAEAAAEVLREAGVSVAVRPGTGPLRAGWADQGE
ncbi:TIGR00341 family protein [Porphyrobacter sp. YT40]|uniref:TIGR00341 family protein n=1 Tax=Porphyrobacter sp. YT40 TaxID=2547601 RepID=UPI001143A285|nr:TIGR00341 family protein [Porphyrobacter sp. YT40]QDH33084.1 TIGR00341 family protein [Porphyrobacter sp. YT40]